MDTGHPRMVDDLRKETMTEYLFEAKRVIQVAVAAGIGIGCTHVYAKAEDVPPHGYSLVLPWHWQEAYPIKHTAVWVTGQIYVCVWVYCPDCKTFYWGEL